MGANCRGIVTADVLVQGLSRGAIAARKLKGVKRDKEYEGYTGSAPYGEGKSLRPVEVIETTSKNYHNWIVGFYLHRKGPNEYKLPVSFVRFNPSKLT